LIIIDNLTIFTLLFFLLFRDGRDMRDGRVIGEIVPIVPEKCNG
jgi:hypothetical protein